MQVVENGWLKWLLKWELNYGGLLKWVIEMGKYGRIKNRYFNLYPKLSKKGITEK